MFGTVGDRRRQTVPGYLEVHPSAVVVTAGGTGLLLLRDVRDQRFRGQDHRGDGSGVLERRAGHLGGVDDALLEEVTVVAGKGVVAVTGLEALDVLDDDLTGCTGVVGDLACRGLEGGVVIEKVRSMDTGQGLNAAPGESGAMFPFGVVDPAKVTRSALQNAASIAALFLTTEAVVAEKPEKEKAAPAMPGGGEMDF